MAATGPGLPTIGTSARLVDEFGLRDYSRHDVLVEDLLRQELAELTEMLRTEPIFGKFRRWLAAQGLDVDRMQLAGLIDNADDVVPGGDGESTGVVVTPEGQAYEFEGNVYDSPGDERFRWTEINPRGALDRWPALTVAIQSEVRRHQRPPC